MGLGERRLKEEKEAWRRVLTGCVCFFIYLFIFLLEPLVIIGPYSLANASIGRQRLSKAIGQ